MKNYFLIILFCLSFAGQAFDELNTQGLLKSGNPREPQVIKIEETEDNTIAFKFCSSKRMESCIFLGREEGYSFDEVERTSEKLMKSSKALTVLKPIMTGIPYAIAGGVAMLSGVGAGVIFISVLVADQLSKQVENDKLSDSEIKDRMAKTINPKAVSLEPILREGISIVEFSYLVERALFELDHCKNTRRGKRCKKFNANPQKVR